MESMRKMRDRQLFIEEVDIADMEFDLRERDEIPQILRGLQHIYCTPHLQEKVFQLLEQIIPDNVDPKWGRPGMGLWKILVMGTLRVNCQWDYDKLLNMVRHHDQIRQMLGQPNFVQGSLYSLQTLRDNLSLLDKDTLALISDLVVKEGHRLVSKQDDPPLMASCDSFVVETDVCYPTDRKLLLQSIQKILPLMARLTSQLGLAHFRQYRHNLKKCKSYYNRVRNMEAKKYRKEAKQTQHEERLLKTYQCYLSMVEGYVVDVLATIEFIRDEGITVSEKALQEIERYLAKAQVLLDQIKRRKFAGEVIPHHEKIFSIFEDHTEWISKGKAGVPQELGKRVCIVKDQYAFILNHLVMDHVTDDKVAVPLLLNTKARYNNLRGCSFDKGYWSPSNLTKLSREFDLVVLPKKGRRSKADTLRETSEEFRENKRRHSAVESSINALGHHGLDRCLDHGHERFCRYVSLAVTARNIQLLGSILHKQEVRREKRKRAYGQTLARKRLPLAA